MIIKYTNNKDDILAEYIFLISRTDEHKKDVRSLKNMYFIFAALMFALAIYDLVLYVKDNETITYLTKAVSQFIVSLLTLSFAFIAPLIRKIIDKITLKSKIKKENRQYKENVLEINDNQIKYYGDEQGVIKLTEQKLVHEDKRYLYIVTRKRTFTIPKKDIEDIERLKKILHGTMI